MTELAKDVAAIDVTDLLMRYSFELGEGKLDRLVDSWLNHYPTQWVRLAVIEALYQGRYKAISVEQILNLWQRRGRPLHRFNHEFERVICGRFPTAHPITPSSQYAPSVRSYKKAPPLTTARPTPTNAPQQIAASSPSLPKLEPQPNGMPEVAPPADPATESIPVFELEGIEHTEALPTSQPESAPVPIFQPNSSADLEPLVALSLSRSTLRRQPIHQFVPSPEASSDFYAKLRAVAQSISAVETD